MFGTHEGIICKTEESRMIGIKTAFLSSIVRLIKGLFYTNHQRCLKITEKVSFNISSEACYVYILKILNSTAKNLNFYAKNIEKWQIQNLFDCFFVTLTYCDTRNIFFALWKCVSKNGFSTPALTFSRFSWVYGCLGLFQHHFMIRYLIKVFEVVKLYWVVCVSLI